MPDRETIRHVLVDLFEAESDRKPDSVADGVNLRDQLGLDSLDLVGVVMQVENHFRIRLTHHELQEVVTVGNLLDLIQDKTAELPPAAAA
jgi:acyl carrier protein